MPWNMVVVSHHVMLGPLEQQTVFLTTELFLQLKLGFFLSIQEMEIFKLLNYILLIIAS